MSVTPDTQEAEIRRIAGQVQSRQKVSRIPSQSISWIWCYTPMIPATKESTNRKSSLRPGLGNIRKFYMKNN
jgi:hypothetical protein